MLKTSMDQKMRWFRYVNQRLGEISVMKDEQRSLKISETAMCAETCQESREEIPNCQEGNEMRSLWDLIDCQEDSEGNSYCQ
jgi:hypothetical protein